MNLQKKLSYFKSTFSNLSKHKVSCKTKNFKFETKNVLFGYFWAVILKPCCHTWNQHSSLYQAEKFHPKQKNFKIETKNTLFCIFELEYEKNIVIFDALPSNYLNAKLYVKTKIFKFQTEIWLQFLDCNWKKLFSNCSKMQSFVKKIFK